MNGAQKFLNVMAAPGRAARKWILFSLLVALVISGSVWMSTYSSAVSAEPDLALIKAAYAGSAINNQAQEISSPLIIPAAAFTADSNTRQWFFGFNSAYLYPTGSTYCGTAPVYLPDGVEVTSFVGYVYDNDAGPSVTENVYLYAKPLGTTTGSTTMASVETTTQSSDIQALADASIASAVIDNSRYTYHLGVCLWGTNGNLRFYAARLDFNLKTYLPAISR